ncbi:MAG TPA: ABC transporter substrate-binding protein [Acidimicrobiia bacterium]|nr:ABC transporter substrate-binding protein [Acidimicrobiia bacterium]
MRTTTRWVAGLAVLGLVLSACSSGTVDDPTTTAPPDDTAATTASTDTDTDTGSAESFALDIAIFEDLTTDNYWAYLDPENSVWNAYVFANQAPALFQYASPTNQLVPLLAEGLPAEPTQEGDAWTITQPLKPGMVWSDGEAITASDIVFTYETVRDLGLGGNWLTGYPIAAEGRLGLLGVEALDDATVKFTFNDRPGLSRWQFGVGLGAVLPEHFWAEAATAATGPEELYAASGAGAPGMWAYDFTEWEPGAFARNNANDLYPFQGSTTRLFADGTYEFTDSSGTTEQYYGEGGGELTHEYTEGPYADEVTYSIYTSQDAAVLALTNGDVDFMLTSLGLQRGLQQLVLAEPDLDLIVNPSNGYRYLAFNTRKFPMGDAAFRRALACLIDKDFMANTVLGGAAIPVWSQVPEGNAFWFNPDTPRWCEGLTQEERLNTSIQVLKEAGYTWDVEPVWDPDNLDAIPRGEGLRGPDGTVVPELDLLAPGPGYDPLRATYSLFIEDWANDLGIPVAANPTGFNVIVDQVFTTDPQFDMYILGWSLTPFPDHVAEFFETAGDSTLGGNNTPGYSNPEFDALAEQFRTVTDLDEARQLVREMDAILAEDLPYVTLFTTPIIEPFRTNLSFPFTSSLDGLQNLFGLPSFVRLTQ